MKTTNLILGVAMIGIAATGCRKSVETERKEAVEAAQNADDKTAKARAEAIDERNEYLAAVRREQLDYRERLHDQLDDVDHKLTDLHADIGRDGIVHYDEHGKDAAKVKELVDRRTYLRTDIDALESSTEKDWEQVKARLDADLGDKVFRRGRI